MQRIASVQVDLRRGLERGMNEWLAEECLDEVEHCPHGTSTRGEDTRKAGLHETQLTHQSISVSLQRKNGGVRRPLAAGERPPPVSATTDRCGSVSICMIARRAWTGAVEQTACVGRSAGSSGTSRNELHESRSVARS